MVSRAYLDAWADARGLVDVADLEQGRVSTTAIRNATVVRYAYETEVMTYDLEGQFARIEGAGISALRVLRETQTLTLHEKHSVVAFLDMHLERGRYADQTQTRAPALLLKSDGTIEEAGLNLGDRLFLTQYMKDVVRLSRLGIEQWPWQILSAKEFATGDGAVILWREINGSNISTVTFPLSPTEMLVIGHELEVPLDLNVLMAMKSRRWLVGRTGAFRSDHIQIVAAQRRTGPVRWIPIPQFGVEIC